MMKKFEYKTITVDNPEKLVEMLNIEGHDGWEYCFHMQLMRAPSALTPGAPPMAVLMVILKKESSYVM